MLAARKSGGSESHPSKEYHADFPAGTLAAKKLWGNGYCIHPIQR
jgi:hypothetical protein